eukprot:1973833-Amphidinium_carterae.3
MACCARTRPRAWPVSCASRGALSLAIPLRTSMDAGPKCPVRACMPSGPVRDTSNARRKPIALMAVRSALCVAGPARW